MAALGVTGARELPVRAATDVVVPALETFRADTFVTGAAIGVDTFVGLWLALRYPEARHVVVVPAYRGLVSFWWERPAVRDRVQVVALPDGASFKDRNVLLVDLIDELHAFTAHTERDSRSLRSGSWQTVRLARKAGKPVTEHLLNP